MHPVFFTIFGHEIHFYQVFYPTALLVTILLSSRWAKKQGISQDMLLGAYLYSLIGILIGARLLDVIVHFSWYIEEPSRILNMRQGVVLYGGYLGAVFGGMGYLKFKRQPFLPYVDVAATWFGIGLAIHRSLACFMAGCCYGRPTGLPWGVTFPPGSRADKVFGQVAVHPTQLYEAAVGLCMFTVLILYSRRRNRVHGEQFGLQMAIYGTARFLMEFVRGDTSRGSFGPLSTSQWISLGLLAAAAGLLIRAARRRRLVAMGKMKPEGTIAGEPLKV